MASVITEPYDVIIVGAGILGMYSAYHMVQKGLRVLMLDQFQIPHKRGSSGDPSRILLLYDEKPISAAMMVEAYRCWKDLELVTGERLLVETGTLAIYDGKLKEKLLISTESLKRDGVKHDVLTANQMNASFPQLHFDAVSTGLYDSRGGCLMATKCNRLLLAEFTKRGGTLRDGEKVTKITPGDVVTISTSRGQQYRARQLVLAPGPWARDLLLSLGLDVPFKTIPALPCYWKEKVPESHSPASGMPVFTHRLDVTEGCQFFYAFPSFEFPGMMKVATRGDPNLKMYGPDDRDRQDRNQVIPHLSAYIQQHLPGLEGDAPAITEGCMYTMTPDEDIVIDRHPHHHNILIAAGGTGRGYKMAPVIGKLITEMATGSATSYDITQFRINRFRSPAKL